MFKDDVSQRKAYSHIANDAGTLKGLPGEGSSIIWQTEKPDAVLGAWSKDPDGPLENQERSKNCLRSSPTFTLDLPSSSL